MTSHRLYTALLVSALAVLPAHADDRLGRLVAAYPEFLAGHDAGTVTWKDGTVMEAGKAGDRRPYADKLRDPTLYEQMEMTYPAGWLTKPPGPEDDPGRFRNVGFFDKMYGDCTRGEVERRLVKVAWLPKSGGGSVRITSINGVAARLAAVSDEIDRLPKAIRAAAFPSAGTYNCRVVKDTGNRSAHAWGIAIDVNTKFSDYWLWSKGAYRNRVPREIVEAFERQGFIWGGKWGHFDTMHFEYRPELAAPR